MKDSKEGTGEEAVAMAEAEASSNSRMEILAGRAVASDAADVMLDAESKKRRVSTKEASINFLDPAKYSPEMSREVETTSTIDGADGNVGGGTVQCDAAAGQASMSEGTVHS